MQLDPQLAKDLVNNFKAITKHEINLFNIEGRIVASTDASRVGQVHEGARIAAATMKPFNIESNDQFANARRGINMPVIFQNSAVAVVGITGDPQEVEAFGTVIKQMAEILLRENWRSISNFNRRANITNLANMLIHKNHDENYVNYLASILGYNLSISRNVIIGSARMSSDQTFDFEKHLFTLNALFQELPQSFFSIAGKEIILFVDENSLHRLELALDSVRIELEERNAGLSIRFGIGNAVCSPQHYWESCLQARQAAQFSYLQPDCAFVRYQTLDSGMLLTAIPKKTAVAYVAKIFRNVPAEDIAYYKEIFDSYTSHNGSIIACADNLALHKNTLQNKLNKIAKLTGYNPRKLCDFPILWLAFNLFQYQQLSIENDIDD